MQEYVKAGGPESSDAELKSDLLRILRREIRDLFILYSANVGVSFQNLRDTVVAQTAHVLMNRGGARSLNAVDAGDGSGDYKKILAKLGDGSGNEDELLDDLCAAINVRRGRGGPAGGRAPQRA